MEREYTLDNRNIGGFNIKEIKITKEEAQLDVTYRRIEELMHLLGSNIFEYGGFFAQEGELVFAGFVANKRPEFFKDIMKEVNQDYYSAYGLMDVLGDESGHYLFYDDFADFVNKTNATKARFNKFALSTLYYYDKLQEE